MYTVLQTGRWRGEQGDMLLKYLFQKTKTIGKQPLPVIPKVQTKLTAGEILTLKMNPFGAQRVFLNQKTASSVAEKNTISKSFDRDHIFPRSKGGSDIPSNFPLLCGHCVKSNGDRTPDDLTGNLV